jgi:hypothetical protein
MGEKGKGRKGEFALNTPFVKFTGFFKILKKIKCFFRSPILPFPHSPLPLFPLFPFSPLLSIAS